MLLLAPVQHPEENFLHFLRGHTEPLPPWQSLSQGAECFSYCRHSHPCSHYLQVHFSQGKVCSRASEGTGGIPGPDLHSHPCSERNRPVSSIHSEVREAAPEFHNLVHTCCLPNVLLHPFSTMSPCVLGFSPGGCPSHPPVLPCNWSASDSMLEAERQLVGPERHFSQGGSFEDWRENLNKNKKVGKRIRYIQLLLLIELGK